MPLTAKSARFSTIFPQIHIRNLSSNCIQNSAVYSVNIIHISKYLCAYSLRFQRNYGASLRYRLWKRLILWMLQSKNTPTWTLSFLPVFFKWSLNLCNRQHYYAIKYFPNSTASLKILFWLRMAFIDYFCSNDLIYLWTRKLKSQKMIKIVYYQR